MEYNLPTCFVSHYQYSTLAAKHYATHNSLVYLFKYEYDSNVPTSVLKCVSACYRDTGVCISVCGLDSTVGGELCICRGL